MANALIVQVDGLQELGRNLRALSEDIQKKVGRAAVGLGARVIRDQAIRTLSAQISAAEDTKRGQDPYLRYLRDNIIAARRRRVRPGWDEFIVTVRHKGKALKQPPRYGRTKSQLKFVGVGGRRKGQFKLKRTSYAWNLNPYTIGIYNEFGTVRMGPQPFMRPAFDQKSREAMDKIIHRLKQRIDKANRAVR